MIIYSPVYMNSMKININTIGNPKNRALVFFHGWGFDHRVWTSTAALLQDKYRIFLVDLPGFGHTSLMSWDEFQQMLLEHLPQKFAIAGWSLGGLYATRLALESGRVSHLINIAASPCFIKKEDWPGVNPQVLEKFLANLETQPRETLEDFVVLQARRKSSVLPETLPATTALRAGLQILESWDLRKPLASANFSIAYCFGRLDSITPFAVLEAMQTHYPQFNYHLFKKSAHMPFLSQQEEFIYILEDFIQ